MWVFVDARAIVQGAHFATFVELPQIRCVLPTSRWVPLTSQGEQRGQAYGPSSCLPQRIC
jgi:hypothetical protein